MQTLNASVEQKIIQFLSDFQAILSDLSLYLFFPGGVPKLKIFPISDFSQIRGGGRQISIFSQIKKSPNHHRGENCGLFPLFVSFFLMLTMAPFILFFFQIGKNLKFCRPPPLVPNLGKIGNWNSFNFRNPPSKQET